MKTIVLDGKTYQEVEVRKGNRHVVVVDRGWIFAGDLTVDGDRLILDRVVWVFRWETVGFDGVLATPKSSSVKLRPIAHKVDLPCDAEVFRVPVADDWGL